MVSGLMTVAPEFMGFCLIMGGIFTFYFKCCGRSEAPVGKKKEGLDNASDNYQCKCKNNT